jgi:hypothetical protein
VAAPSESLLFKKASGAVPHTGGKRFDETRSYCQTMLNWIEAGAPDDPANLHTMLVHSPRFTPKEFVCERPKVRQRSRSRFRKRFRSRRASVKTVAR